MGGKRSKGNDQDADNAGGGDDGGQVQLRNKRGRSEQLNGQVGNYVDLFLNLHILYSVVQVYL